MIEMNGAATGLLVTEGHRDEIEMRRVHKEQIWDPSYPAPPPIARRRARIPIPERMDFEGEVLLAARRGRGAPGRAAAEDSSACDSIAVMFLFSFVNPEHERRAAEIIREEFPDVDHVSLSHEVMAAGPGVRARVDHAGQRVRRAADRRRTSASLQEKLRAAGYAGQLLIMQSTGGVMPPDYVARRAVSLLASGPDRRRDGRGAGGGQGRHRRLRRRRHGRHQLRPLPRPRRAARDQDRLELAVPLLHRPADGRRAERRRRRRLDRPRPPGRAARRPGERRVARPGRSATGAAATARR